MKKVRRMANRIMSLFLALVMLCAVQDVTVFAQTEDTFAAEETSDEAAQKEFEDAKSAIESALADIEVSNNTTQEEMLNAVEAAIPTGSSVTVRVDLGFEKATTTAEGSLAIDITLYCGEEYDFLRVVKTIPMVNTQDVADIEEDQAAVKKELNKVTANNKTTKEELLNIARAAAKHGTTVAWGPDLKMTKADFENDGLISGTIFLTLNKVQRTVFVYMKIPMFVRKIPSNQISVCAEEWEILRLVNVERAKNGGTPLLMTSDLQTACNIREKELSQKYSHTRPNGKSCFTAVSSKAQSRYMGENIAWQQGYRSDNMPFPQRFMNSWMNSKEHRENILDRRYGYIGVGFYETSSSTRSRKWSVQIFSGGSIIKSWTTSSGKTNFENADAMMEDYLICTDSSGAKAYMPLDTAYMKKTDIGYTMQLGSSNPVTLSIGKENAGKELVQPVVKKTSLSKKPKPGKKRFTVYWKKIAGISGYEISYSTSGKFTDMTTESKVVTKASSTKLTVKKLKAKKKYYVRIRTYKTVDGINYYSEWSAKKSVVTKK